MEDWRAEHGLDDAIAQWMRGGGDPVEVDAGARVDPRISGTLCLLLDGWLVRTRRVSDERTAILATYLPGDIVMLDVWSGEPDGDELHSLTPATMTCRPVDDFERVLDDTPAIARAVIRRLAQEAGMLRVGLTAVGRLDAQERLVVYLAQLRRRLVAGGSLASDACRFAFPLTQAQLANAIGITNVHVNRVLSSLRRSNLLTIARGEVEVHDWPAFQRIAAATTD